jgi:outer membrane protein assembly factor BamB
VDGCFLEASQAVYGGELQSTSLGIDPTTAYTVCVDCIGGTIKPLDVGGGPPVARQWGYRTESGGAVVDMPGETGETYVLKGASFPEPRVYYVVVRTTPACGSVTVSGELMVRVLADVPGDEVQHLAVTSRGTSAAGGRNVVRWVNATLGNDVRLRWNKAPAPNSPCVPPASADAASQGVEDLLAPLTTVSTFAHVDDGTPPGLDPDTAYCYSVFVRAAGDWSMGRTVQGRPFDSDAGPVKWAYSTGATAVAPPVVGYDGILVMSNDRTVHSVTRGGASGGDWPASWVPYAMDGVAHSRSPVVPFDSASAVFPDRSVLFVADDTGFVHAVQAADGAPAWTPPHSAGKPVVGAPGGLFTQWGGIADLVIVATRETPGPNELRGLAAGTGALVGSPFTAGGTIGAISGSPAIDYTTQRVYFTSRSAGGPTVWCVEVDGSTPFVPCAGWAPPAVGDVDGSPVLRNGRLYFGTVSGVVHSLDATTGGDDRTFTTGDGPVKGFLFPDRRNDDLMFATDTKVWSISDTGASTMEENWQWTDLVNGLNPSIVLYRPATSLVYVGSRNGRLYELDFTAAAVGTAPTHAMIVLGDGLAQVGAPSLDVGVDFPDVNAGKKLLVVGSESGTVYGVEVPF